MDTAEGTLDVITTNLQRISDLVTEAANGTYSNSDKQAISEEVQDRVTEIKHLAADSTFNGVSLFGDTTAGTGAAVAGVTLQVGTVSADTINLDSSIFAAVDSTTLAGLDTLATTIYNAGTGGATSSIGALVPTVTTMTDNIVGRVTKIGADQNQLQAVAEGLSVQQINLTAARSTTTDADVAQESANYVSSQILQNASATLLVQENSAPQIALTLIKGG